MLTPAAQDNLQLNFMPPELAASLVAHSLLHALLTRERGRSRDGLADSSLSVRILGAETSEQST